MKLLGLLAVVLVVQHAFSRPQDDSLATIDYIEDGALPSNLNADELTRMSPIEGLEPIRDPMGRPIQTDHGILVGDTLDDQENNDAGYHDRRGYDSLHEEDNEEVEQENDEVSLAAKSV